MRKVHIGFLFCLFYLSAFPQSSNKFGRTYSDTIPDNFYLNAAALREHIYAGIPSHLKVGWQEKALFHFSNNAASNISNLMASGKIYGNWGELENYLNQLLRKVMPPELEKDSMIHVYVVEDGSFNAYMTPSGHIFVHVGLLPEVLNEAMIAGILAHELAHYYLRHSLYTFLQKAKGEFDIGIFTFSDRLYNRYSQANELDCDSLAVRWLKLSGYPPDAMLDNFDAMQRLEKNIIKQSETEWFLEATTHPLSEERTDQVKKFCTENMSVEGKYFLIDENKFNAFRKEAQTEVLKIHLNEFNYSDCIEKAFRFHLFDPDNPANIYYLVEGIRRHCYLLPEQWSNMFITNRYFQSEEKDFGQKYKRKMTDPLFASFNFDILPINPEEGGRLKGKFYWKGEPKFKTYEEAFNFFYRVSQQLGIDECILSNALSFTRDKARRDTLLKKYLGCADIVHRKYAESLLADSILKKLPHKKLMVFHHFDVTIRQGKNDIVLPEPVLVKNNPLAFMADSVVVGLPIRTPLYMSGLSQYRYNEFKILDELENFSMTRIISQGEKARLYLLDPKYWTTMYNYKVNEIEFINGRYFESYPPDKSLASYKEIISKDYNKIFSNVKNVFYCEAYISSVRQIEGGIMKIRYYSGETKINPNRAVTSHIAAYIRNAIKQKEKFAANVDYASKHN